MKDEASARMSLQLFYISLYFESMFVLWIVTIIAVLLDGGCPFLSHKIDTYLGGISDFSYLQLSLLIPSLISTYFLLYLEVEKEKKIT